MSLPACEGVDRKTRHREGAVETSALLQLLEHIDLLQDGFDKRLWNPVQLL